MDDIINKKHDSIKQKNETRFLQCPVYRKCGGCQLQNMSYAQQLKWKQNKVENLLKKFGEVSPIIGMDNPYHYRKKVQAAFFYDRKNKKNVSGVYQSSTHRVVSIDNCMIEDEKADAIIVSIRRLLTVFKIKPYDELTQSGLLRHVLVKCGFQSGQIMVVLVTASPIFPAKHQFVKALLKEHPEITTILQNINSQNMNLILGDRQNVLYGTGTINDYLCGCVFRISAKSFYQINPVQTQILYEKAISFAQLTGKETILDAYCGTGTIGLIACKKAANLIGVESNKDAVQDAIFNAKQNKIKNAWFYHADAGQFMDTMVESGKKADVVFMDPPRAGSNMRFLTSLSKLAPNKIVYISCNPETLERDLTVLVQKGYRVQKIQAVDMFPHTAHVETCVLLSHKNS